MYVILAHQTWSGRLTLSPFNRRFHDLRHTVAFRLNERGVDPVAVMNLLGHASLKTTEIYLHSSFKANGEGGSSLKAQYGLRTSGDVTDLSANRHAAEAWEACKCFLFSQLKCQTRGPGQVVLSHQTGVRIPVALLARKACLFRSAGELGVPPFAL